MVLQGVEVAAPVGPVRSQPLVDLRQRGRTQAIHPTLRLLADRHQTRLPEQLQMFRHRRLVTAVAVDLGTKILTQDNKIGWATCHQVSKPSVCCDLMTHSRLTIR